MDIKEVLLLWFIIFFDIQSVLLAVNFTATDNGFKSAIKDEVKQNEQLSKELNKPIIRKFEKRKVQSLFKTNILGADLADMQLISKSNKGFRLLLCFIDIFIKYAWYFWFSYSAALTGVESKKSDVSNLVKKQIVTQKYWRLNLNTLLQLITINLQVKHMMQR